MPFIKNRPPIKPGQVTLSSSRPPSKPLNLAKEILRLLDMPQSSQFQAKVRTILKQEIKIQGKPIDVIDHEGGKIYEAFLPLVAHTLYHQLIAD